MSEFLDHAITVRDVMYVWLGALSLLVLTLFAAALYLHLLDKKRATLNENLRNPVYGIPKRR